MKLERYILDLVYGRKQGLLASILKSILTFFSYLFGFGVKLRNRAFDNGLLSKYRPHVPVVISIGNIVAGGSGKTPLTLLLANEFYDEFKIAILSRGYKSSAEKNTSPTVLSDGKGPVYTAHYCGDEPYLISDNLPRAIVIVGKNRQLASTIAAKLHTNVIILDDGMQHRQLARDFEVVVMDAKDPFGQGYFLPRGLLRDEISSLARADIVMLNQAESNEQFIQVSAQVSKYTKAPIVGCHIIVGGVFDLSGNDMPILMNKKVGIFCAIAKPENFKKTVLDAGAVVLDELFLPDHNEFRTDEIKQFSDNCKKNGIEWLLCTEKDKVKLQQNLQLSLPIVWLKISLHVTEGVQEWKSFIQKAKKDIIRQI
jgi:tetraacyldisaccharide 4'-kinase